MLQPTKTSYHLNVREVVKLTTGKYIYSSENRSVLIGLLIRLDVKCILQNCCGLKQLFDVLPLRPFIHCHQNINIQMEESILLY